jgi:deazaflavin-dependent oxidoreductase (nitroreductase family)
MENLIYSGRKGCEPRGGELSSADDRQSSIENRQSGHSVLYLTTTGRVSGLPREIEIWFVESGETLYLLAEHFHRAHWVQNIQRDANIRIRIGKREWRARGRVLDPEADREQWDLAQELSRQKYGWGDGLPVEIADFRCRSPF